VIINGVDKGTWFGTTLVVFKMIKPLRPAPIHFRDFRYTHARGHKALQPIRAYGCSRIPLPSHRPGLNHKTKLPTQFSSQSRAYLTKAMDTSSALNTRAHLSPAQLALLPKDKHDDAAIAHISTLPESEIEPLLPEILTWLQDPNWPIARTVLPFILQHPALIVEPLRQVLRTDDVEWIYVVLCNVIKEMPLEERRKMRVEIERIAREPTEEEKENELDVDAQGILDGLDAKKEEE
jgi:hypothetical protein